MAIKKCRTCNGTGLIGKDINCPFCKGEGEINADEYDFKGGSYE